jgi:hypothetical protein
MPDAAGAPAAPAAPFKPPSPEPGDCAGDDGDVAGAPPLEAVSTFPEVPMNMVGAAPPVDVDA